MWEAGAARTLGLGPRGAVQRSTGSARRRMGLSRLGGVHGPLMPPPSGGGGDGRGGSWRGWGDWGRRALAAPIAFWRRTEEAARQDADAFGGDVVASAVWQVLCMLCVVDVAKLQDAHGMLFSQRAFKESLRGLLYLVAALLLAETTVVLGRAATGVAELRRRLIGYQIVCVVPDASGLAPGAEVRFRGVRCGTVLGVSLRPEGAEVTFRVADKHFRIPRSAQVRLNRQGMAGWPMLNIDVPGTAVGEQKALSLNREEEARHRRGGGNGTGDGTSDTSASFPAVVLPEGAAEAWDEFSQRLGLPRVRDPLFARGGSVLPGEHLHGETGTSIQGIIYLAVRLLRASRAPDSAAHAFHDTFRARLWGLGATHDLQRHGRFALAEETVPILVVDEDQLPQTKPTDRAEPTALQQRGRERGQQISAGLEVAADRLVLRTLHVYVGSKVRSEVPEYHGAAPVLVRRSLRRVGAFRRNVLAPVVSGPTRRLAAAFRARAVSRPRFTRFSFRATTTPRTESAPRKEVAPKDIGKGERYPPPEFPS